MGYQGGGGRGGGGGFRGGRGGGGDRGGRGGGFRGGRGGGFRGGRGGGGGGRFHQEDQGPPESVDLVGVYMQPCVEDMVFKLTHEKIPYFNAPIYLENKEQIGKVDEIFGPIKDAYFSVKTAPGVKAQSLTKDTKVFIDSMKLLPLARFLPQTGPRGRGGRGGRGGGDRGGRGGGDRGGRGGFGGGRGGRGDFRGGRGGFDRGRGGGGFDRGGGRGGGGFDRGGGGGFRGRGGGGFGGGDRRHSEGPSAKRPRIE